MCLYEALRFSLIITYVHSRLHKYAVLSWHAYTWNIILCPYKTVLIKRIHRISSRLLCLHESCDLPSMLSLSGLFVGTGHLVVNVTRFSLHSKTLWFIYIIHLGSVKYMHGTRYCRITLPLKWNLIHRWKYSLIKWTEVVWAFYIVNVFRTNCIVTCTPAKKVLGQSWHPLLWASLWSF